MARLSRAGHTSQYHPHASAAQVPRTQSGGECVAVHARQLVVEPHLPIIRRHRRPLLLRMEQARRSTMANYVYRLTKVGSWVVINALWYKVPDRR